MSDDGILAGAIGALGVISAALIKLKASRKDYEQMCNWIRENGQVVPLFQPVLMLGPWGSGKTSLMRTWMLPWANWEKHQRSLKVLHHEIPILDRPAGTRAHHLDPNLKVPATYHLGIDLHDVPADPAFWDEGLGEFYSEHEKFQNALRSEKAQLPQFGETDTATTLILMLNCDRVEETIGYYGTKFLSNMNAFFANRRIFSRCVIVFNKIDKLSECRRPDIPATCEERFAVPLREIWSLCDALAISYLSLCFTVLGRAAKASNLRGARETGRFSITWPFRSWRRLCPNIRPCRYSGRATRSGHPKGCIPGFHQ